MAGVMPGVSGTAMASNQELLQALKRGEKEGRISANRLKIQLLGDSCAGKTSLRKHLMGEPVIDGLEPRTVGIERYDLEYHQLTEDWTTYKGSSEYNRCIASWVMKHNRENIGSSLNNHIAPSLSVSNYAAFAILGMPILAVLLNFYGCAMGLATVFILYQVFSAICLQSWSAVQTFAQGSFFVIFFKMVMYQAVDLGISELENGLCALIVLFFGVWLTYIGLRGFVIGLGVLKPPAMTLWQSKSSLEKVTQGLLFRDVTRGQVFTFFILEVLSDVTLLTTLFLMVGKSKPKEKAFLFGFAIFTTVLIASIQQSYSALWHFLYYFLLPIGLGLGRKLVLHFKLAYFVKIFLNIIMSFAIGYFVLGWKAELSYHSLATLIFLAIDIFDWVMPQSKLRGGVLGNTVIPVDELIRAMSAIDSGESSLPAVFTVMDFAGNPEYTNMHYTFISEQAIYVIVFDLRKLQGSQNAIEEQISRIKYWLNNISMKVSLKKKPVVFLVGSHRDSLFEVDNASDCIEEFAKAVTITFDGSQQFEDWFVINEQNNSILFTVENTKVLKSDKASKRFRELLLAKGREEIDNSQENLLKWFHVIDLCQKEKRNGKNFIRVAELLEKCHNLNDHDLKTMTIEDLHKCLEFAHSKDYVIFRREPKLEHWVILEPRFLVDVMARFQDPNQHWGYLLKGHVKKLEESGIASEKLTHWILKDAHRHTQASTMAKHWQYLYLIWDKLQLFIQFAFNTDGMQLWGSKTLDVPDNNIMFQYLQDLNFFIEVAPDPKDNQKSKRYLLPCRLPHGEGIDLTQGNWSTEMFIDTGEFAIQHCFPAFISEYLSKYTSTEIRHQLDECAFYRDRAKIYNPDFGTLTLQCNYNDAHNNLQICLATEKENMAKAAQWILQSFDKVAQRDNIPYTAGPLCTNPACDKLQQNKKHILPVLQLEDNNLTLKEVWCNDILLSFDTWLGDMKHIQPNSTLKQNLINNWDYIVENLLVDHLSGPLLAANVITMEQHEQLMLTNGLNNKARILLTTLARKPDDKLQTFLEVLSAEDHGHVTERLIQ